VKPKAVLVRSKVPPPPERVLKPGELTRFEDGSVWKVEHVTRGSADVRCVIGGGANRAGRSLTISRSSVGHTLVTDQDVETAKAVSTVLKSQCDPCWAKHGPEDPCPTDCWCHDAKYKPREVRRGGPDPADVVAVLELRAGGMGYAAIEKAMGWKDSHGSRAWKIVKDAERSAKEGG